MFGLGVGEIALIVVLLVLIFGANRIPLIARGLGRGIRNFKGEISSGSEGDGTSDPSDERDRGGG